MENIDTLHIGQFQSLERTHDFYVNTLRNHLETFHHYIERPHRHAFTVVVYFTQGVGTHDIDFKQYHVTPGSLFILYPGQVHSWALSSDCDGYIFFHSSLLFDEQQLIHGQLQKFRIQQLFLPSLFIPFIADHHFHRLWKQLLQEYLSNSFWKNIYLATLVTQIYIEILRPLVQSEMAASKTQRTYQQWYHQFENLLEADFKKDKSVATYASKMFLSPKHLNRIANAVVGKSASHIILDRVVLEAKRMLVNSSKSLGEIADELGYEDYAYFSKVFKKNTGVTPSRFLKEIA
ncbi:MULTISPECIES: helix-turn-helix domain-containing protein [Chitinophagaceae]